MGVSCGRFWLAPESWSKWMRDLEGFVSLGYQSLGECLCRSVTSSISSRGLGLFRTIRSFLWYYAVSRTNYSQRRHTAWGRTPIWLDFRSLLVDLCRCLRLEWCTAIMTVVSTREGVVEVELKLWCRNFMAYRVFVAMLSRMQCKSTVVFHLTRYAVYFFLTVSIIANWISRLEVLNRWTT